MRNRIVVALVAALMAAGAVTAVAAPVPNPDPCQALYKANTIANLQAYEKCRLDRIEAAIPGNQTVTVTPAPVTVTAPPVTATVTVTASAEPTPTPSSSEPPTTSESTPAESPEPTPTSTAPPPAPLTFPDASTTGVPEGTALKRIPEDITSGPGWRWDARGWVSVYGDGAVFEGYRTRLNVDITASNVVARNNLLEFDSNSWGFSLRHTTNVTIERNTIHGGSTAETVCDNAIRDIYADSDGVKILKNNIYGCSSGINAFSRGGLIQGNYIHDLGYTCPGGDPDCGHFNGIQLASGSGPLMTIQNNTILVPPAYTDAIMLANDGGAQTNRTITDNLLAGGAYTLYAAGWRGAPATNIKVTGNHFSTRYFPNGGYYGAVANWFPVQAGNVWADNTWADGPKAGQPVTP